jgi:hypothetical protein
MFDSFTHSPVCLLTAIEWSFGVFVIVFLCSLLPGLAWVLYRLRRRREVRRWHNVSRLLAVIEDDKLARIPQFHRMFMILTTLHLIGAVYLYVPNRSPLPLPACAIAMSTVDLQAASGDVLKYGCVLGMGAGE